MPTRRSSTRPERPQAVALYARVSTEDQAERQTVDMQTDFLRRYCDLHELPVAGVYVDDGVSGTVPLTERPAGGRLLADAAEGRFGAVLVYRLDRLGRNLRALLDAHDRLDRLGIAIRSTTEPFDTATPIGQFLFQLLGSLAELEKSTIIERTTLGRDRVARAGKWTNGSVPFGYDLDDAGRLVPSARLLPHGEAEADVVRDVYRRVALGATLITETRRLEALGVPSILRWPGGRPDVLRHRWWPPHLHRMLVNPVYKGEYTLNSRNGPVPMPVPALVTPELWERAQLAMTRNRDLSKAVGARDYLLRGLVRCRTEGATGPVCGRTYVGAPGSARRRDGSQRLYYHCSGSRAHSQAPDRPRCPGRSVPMALLEERVWEDVRAFARDPRPALAAARAVLDARRPEDGAADAERERLGRVLAAKAAERERAQILFTKGLASIDDTERAIHRIDAEDMACRALLGSLDADAAALDATRAQLDRTALLVASLLPLVEAGDAGDRAARRRVIETLVREVAVVTTSHPRTSRRQKRDPKHVHVVVRYRHAPAPDGAPTYGSIPSGLAEGILRYIDGLTIDRELVLVTTPNARHA
jgi:site-specific DNA recombinase